jgi:hypothetical protein
MHRPQFALQDWSSAVEKVHRKQSESYKKILETEQKQREMMTLFKARLAF